MTTDEASQPYPQTYRRLRSTLVRFYRTETSDSSAYVEERIRTDVDTSNEVRSDAQ